MKSTLEHEVRPWGEYSVLLDEPNYKVKRIIVKPGGRLSYQYHEKRQEQWTVVEGTALITLDDENHTVSAGDSFFIPQGSKHRVANNGPDDLVFIEVQTGTYFGEDDIVRLEDDYERT